MFELSCLLPAHTHGHLSPEPSRSAATAEEMCHRMTPRHNSNVAAQEGHSVAPILIQGKYFPQYGRLSEHCHRLASWMRASRDFLPWILAKVIYSGTSADKQIGQGKRGGKTEGLGSSSKDQGLPEPMPPCQCDSPESSCQHGRLQS